MCQACAGVHRQFGHRVKSVSHGKFTDAEVSALQQGGNEVARRTYLAGWDVDRCPRPLSQFDSSTDAVVRFIKQVFVDRVFFQEGGPVAGAAPAGPSELALPAVQVAPVDAEPADGGGWESFDTTTPPASIDATLGGGGQGGLGGGNPLSPNLLSAMTPGADAKAIHSLAQPAPVTTAASPAGGPAWESFTPQPNRAPPPGGPPRSQRVAPVALDTLMAPPGGGMPASGNSGAWAPFSSEKEPPVSVGKHQPPLAAPAPAGAPEATPAEKPSTMAELPDLFSLGQPGLPAGASHGNSPVPQIQQQLWQEPAAVRQRAYTSPAPGAAATHSGSQAYAMGGGQFMWQPQAAGLAQPVAVAAQQPSFASGVALAQQPAGVSPSGQFWAAAQQPGGPRGGLQAAEAPSAPGGAEGRVRRFSAGNPFA